MDFQLRCNSLACRTPLSERAVVTTCSHIFCERCSEHLVAVDGRHGSRRCPACDASLNNADDAALTSLNPSEDYKTSVLSGLSPATILECATRGVGFFQYQATQELTYQSYMSRNLTEKYHNLGAQMDSVIAEANREIATLRDRLEASHNEQKDLEKKNNELIHAFKAKSSALQKLQKMYQETRKRADVTAVQDAAAISVDDVLHSAIGNNHSAASGPQRPPQAHLTGVRSPSILLNRRAGAGSADHADRYSSAWQDNTPLNHQRSGRSTFAGRGSFDQGVHNPAAFASDRILHPTPVRQPLCAMDGNSGLFNGFPRDVGISGRAKVGRSTGAGGNIVPGPGAKHSGPSFIGLR